jgi:hypothetical protein
MLAFAPLVAGEGCLIDVDRPEMNTPFVAVDHPILNQLLVVKNFLHRLNKVDADHQLVVPVSGQSPLRNMEHFANFSLVDPCSHDTASSKIKSLDSSQVVSP